MEEQNELSKDLTVEEYAKSRNVKEATVTWRIRKKLPEEAPEILEHCQKRKKANGYNAWFLDSVAIEYFDQFYTEKEFNPIYVEENTDKIDSLNKEIEDLKRERDEYKEKNLDLQQKMLDLKEKTVAIEKHEELQNQLKEKTKEASDLDVKLKQEMVKEEKLNSQLEMAKDNIEQAEKDKNALQTIITDKTKEFNTKLEEKDNKIEATLKENQQKSDKIKELEEENERMRNAPWWRRLTGKY